MTSFQPRFTPRRACIALAVATLPWPWAAFAGETRCWIDRGALVAPAAFGDIAGDFLIDLASPVSQLHMTRAQEDGVQASAPGGGEVVVRRRLRIAGQSVEDAPLRVADLDGRLGAFDASLNGVIGADILGRFLIAFEPAPCRLKLTPRIRGVAPPRARIPVQMLAGRPVTEIMIGDGVRLRTGLFALDTGDWTTTLWRARPERRGGGERLRLRALELDGRLFEQVPAKIAEDPEEGRLGMIGMSVLSRSRFRLDVVGGWLEIHPQGRPPQTH